MTDSFKNENEEFGSDPTEGKSHPVGGSLGAAAGAVAGAAAGAVAGPIGSLGAGLIGGIAGWLEGKTVAEGINPDDELKYWNEHYGQRPYFKRERTWEDYRPAYLAGIYTYSPKHRYDEAEKNIEADWQKIRGNSRLDWNEARLATRDAWDRLDRSRH